MAADSPATKTLSKCGDVILHVGQGQEVEYQLLVSSVLLSHVSPVFAAMFDGRFAEGQSLSAVSPRVVSLLDDDAETTYTVCKIIHAKTADLSVTATPKELIDIAIFCDKYDCVDAVRSWGIIWVAHILEEPDNPDFEETLAATYLLDLAPEFQKVSRSLVRDRSAVSSVETLSDSRDLIPRRLAELIVHEQRETRTKVLEAVGTIVPATGAMCEAYQLRAFQFLRELRIAGVWPLCVVSIANCRKAFEEVSEADRRRKGYCTKYHCLCTTSVTSGDQSVDEQIKDIYDSTRSPCLDCVKRREKAIGNRPVCRTPCSSNKLEYD